MQHTITKDARTGEQHRWFHCPGCKVWGRIDDDQFNGRVSILCDCGFHETINLNETGKFVETAEMFKTRKAEAG